MQRSTPDEAILSNNFQGVKNVSCTREPEAESEQQMCMQFCARMDHGENIITEKCPYLTMSLIAVRDVKMKKSRVCGKIIIFSKMEHLLVLEAR
jgi:hypothetical protein